MSNTEAPQCNAPVAGGCERPATEILLARSGDNIIGNGMAVWTVYWRCGTEHSAASDADRIREVDPEAAVLVLSSAYVLKPGDYDIA